MVVVNQDTGQIKNAVTKIRTWVFAATMQSTYHYTITAYTSS